MEFAHRLDSQPITYYYAAVFQPLNRRGSALHGSTLNSPLVSNRMSSVTYK